MCAGSLVLSCVCLRSACLEELLENVMLPFSLDLDLLGLNHSNDAASQTSMKLLSPTLSPLGAASVARSSPPHSCSKYSVQALHHVKDL